MDFEKRIFWKGRRRGRKIVLKSVSFLTSILLRRSLLVFCIAALVGTSPSGKFRCSSLGHFLYDLRIRRYLPYVNTLQSLNCFLKLHVARTKARTVPSSVWFRVSFIYVIEISMETAFFQSLQARHSERTLCHGLATKRQDDPFWSDRK